MRKRRFLLLALALLLSACGAKEEAPAPAATQPSTQPTAAVEQVQEKTVITIIAAKNSQKTAQWWENFEKTYEQANPQLDLDITCAAWQDVNALIRERIAQGNPPDLANTDSFRSYQQEGLLLPASQWVSQETLDAFYPSLTSRLWAENTLWGVPDYAQARALYYNADILAAAGVAVPTTWSELTTACQQLRAYDYELWPWGVDMTMDEGYACFAYYIWNNGSDFRDEQGNWTLDHRKNLEAVEFITGMVDKRLTNPDPTAQSRYELQELFGQGKIAMMIAPSSLPAYCAAEGNTVNFGIAPLPTNGGNASISTASGNFFLCFADEARTGEELAAISGIVDAFYQDETYTQWVQLEGFLPATTTGNALLARENPQMEVWHQILGNLKFYPTDSEQWSAVREGAVAALQYTLWEDNAWLQLDSYQKEISGATR